MMDEKEQGITETKDELSKLAESINLNLIGIREFLPELVDTELYLSLEQSLHFLETYPQNEGKADQE